MHVGGTRLTIICSFAWAAIIILHGQIMPRWFVPFVYIQIANALLIFKAYKWIDYGNYTKWAIIKNDLKGAKFYSSKDIKIFGWSSFILGPICMIIAITGNWLNFIVFTHVPLIFLIAELHMPKMRKATAEDTNKFEEKIKKNKKNKKKKTIN